MNNYAIINKSNLQSSVTLSIVKFHCLLCKELINQLNTFYTLFNKNTMTTVVENNYFTLRSKLL